MQQTEATAASTGIERQRVESVVQTLAALHSGGESLAEIAHDARNMVTALGLYCELLEEPGVLVPAFAHYGSELRLVAAASRRLVEKLVTLDNPAATETGFRRSDAPAAGHWPVSLPYGSPLASPPLASHPLLSNAHWDLLPSMPVTNLAAELLATRNLLTALAGPAIALTVSTEGGAQPVGIRCEDLTRVLVNLVKNAVEAMPSGGRIQITLREQKQGLLAVVLEDNGPGIPADAVEKIFESGYTVHAPTSATGARTPLRGLGLAISRSIAEAAGGRLYAENRALGGARMVLELPVE